MKYATEMDNYFINGVKYIGPYCTSPNGSLYTGQYFNPRSSKLLQKSQYQKVVYTEFTSVNVVPTNVDYNNGYMYRYFAKNINNLNIVDIVQIDKDQFYNLNDPLYYKFKIKWIISGNSKSDVIQKNTLQIENIIKENKYASDLIYLLVDKSQFYPTQQNISNKEIDYIEDELTLKC